MDLPEPVCPPFNLEDFQDIIDVRSPSEFAEDHLPGAINLPVLDDEERHQVGELHASRAFEARRLGATIITNNIHRHLCGPLSSKPPTFAPLIYCWRGNLRSHSMATILRAIGWRVRVLDGGYKAWRKFLLEDLVQRISPSKPKLVILAGLTGCGKTRLLHKIERQGGQVLDLEKLANHRGSILGDEPLSAQPTQRMFETRVWKSFCDFNPDQPVFTEAESNRIGRRQCPAPLWKRMGKSEVVLLDLKLSERAKILAEDYPHFIEQPDLLKQRLDGLRRLRGNEQVDLWHQQIDQSDWSNFLTSILKDHYDLVYRKPGSPDSSYRKPVATIQPSSCQKSEYHNVARDLIQQFS